MNQLKDILDRLKKYYNAENNRQLAKKIGVNYQTLNTWLKRNKIPYDLLHQIGQNENISIDWLLTGRGEMFLKDNTTVINGISGSNIDKAVIAHNGIAVMENKGNIGGNNNTVTFSNLSDEDKTIQELIETFKQLPPELQEYHLHIIKAELKKYQYEQKKQNQGKI